MSRSNKRVPYFKSAESDKAERTIGHRRIRKLTNKLLRDYSDDVILPDNIREYSNIADRKYNKDT